MISQKCWPSPSSLVPLMAAVPQLYSVWKLTFRLSQLSRVAEDLFRSSHTQSKSAAAEETRAGGHAGQAHPPPQPWVLPLPPQFSRSSSSPQRQSLALPRCTVCKLLQKEASLWPSQSQKDSPVTGTALGMGGGRADNSGSESESLCCERRTGCSRLAHPLPSVLTSATCGSPTPMPQGSGCRFGLRGLPWVSCSPSAPTLAQHHPPSDPDTSSGLLGNGLKGSTPSPHSPGVTVRPADNQPGGASYSEVSPLGRLKQGSPRTQSVVDPTEAARLSAQGACRLRGAPHRGRAPAPVLGCGPLVIHGMGLNPQHRAPEPRAPTSTHEASAAGRHSVGTWPSTRGAQSSWHVFHVSGA